MINVLIGIFFLSHSNWVSFTAFEQKNRRDETARFCVVVSFLTSWLMVIFLQVQRSWTVGELHGAWTHGTAPNDI